VILRQAQDRVPMRYPKLENKKTPAQRGFLVWFVLVAAKSILEHLLCIPEPAIINANSPHQLLFGFA